MQAIIKTSVLIAVITLFFSCKIIQKPVSSTAPNDNQTYQVDYLFEHEGCKVYRFVDHGNYVYFTNCNGDVTSIENDSTQIRVVNRGLNNIPK